MKVSVAQNLNIEAFSGAGITDYSSGNTNTILLEKEGQPYITQRPSIDISESTAALGLSNRGRGIYYWENNSKLYIVNGASVYAQSQSAAAIGTIGNGTEAVTILETIGTPYLIFLDAENNAGWYMSAGEVFTQLVTNFPTTLCHGGTVLDSYLFVMDESGVIYNSNVGSITFAATSFLTAERENDKGVYLGQHHDHVVAFGSRSVEFFYNASNITGSPLNRRQDVSYNIGAASGTAFWENGDVTYFIGSERSGQMAVYELRSFQITQISSGTLNSYITQNITQDGLKCRLSGIQFMGRDILIMTIYYLTGTTPGAIVPSVSFSYDATAKRWEFINTVVNGHTLFPLMAFTRRTGGQNATVAARSGEGIFHNGDILNINDRLIPIDTLLGSSGVYADGVYEVDVYVGASTSNGVNIPITIRTGLIDGGYNGYKTQAALNVEMESTSTAQTLTIKKSNEVTNSFDSGRTIDTSKPRKELRAGGRFIRRNFQAEYSGNEQIFIKALDLTAEAGL